MDFTKRHIVGIGFCIAIIILDFFLFRQSKLFYFVIGIALIIAALPFIISVVIETGREKEKEEMFLEFARSLVESVKSGTPISRSIINMRDKDYGTLTPHIKKLANQIALGIPVKQALKIFANDCHNAVISRAVILIGEAEQAGGQIDTILESVAKSVSEIEDVKKEQKSAVYNIVVQGYIIFLIFIIVMLIVELKIIPLTVNLPGAGGEILPGSATGFGSPRGLTPEQLSFPFLLLLIVQGFFAGLVIGKLSEGNIKSGLIHSFVLMFLAYLVTTGVRAIVSTPVVAT